MHYGSEILSRTIDELMKLPGIGRKTAQRLAFYLLKSSQEDAVALANASLQGRNIPAKCEAISKAIAIIDGGLKASLDLKVGGELAQNLSDLYAYMTQRLLHANLKNDLAALEEVSILLQQLGSAWATLAALPVVATPATPARPQGAATSYGTA